MFWNRRITDQITIYTDGAIRPDLGRSGIAAVVFNQFGNFEFFWQELRPSLTCNEAEYHAAIMAIKKIREFSPKWVVVKSDSEIMVHQMNGIAVVRSPKLKPLRAELLQLSCQLPRADFIHIPREDNRLADALANMAADTTLIRKN